MNSRDQENRLELLLNLRLFLLVAGWLLVGGYIGFRLYTLSKTVVAPGIISVKVTSLKQDNFEVLRTNFKAAPPQTDKLPIIRPEPFD